MLINDNSSIYKPTETNKQHQITHHHHHHQYIYYSKQSNDKQQQMIGQQELDTIRKSARREMKHTDYETNTLLSKIVLIQDKKQMLLHLLDNIRSSTTDQKVNAIKALITYLNTNSDCVDDVIDFEVIPLVTPFLYLSDHHIQFRTLWLLTNIVAGTSICYHTHRVSN
jgi:hypothetical protein